MSWLNEARLANKDVGLVHAGQPVKVKIETFNFTRYGMIAGRVIEVSRDVVPNDPQTAAENGETQGGEQRPALTPSAASPTDSAHIALSRTDMQVDGVRRPLTPGMAITAEIRTGSRSIADYLLSPIARRTQESLHER